MGAGSRVLRTLIAAGVAAAGAACVEFVEPDLPERGAAAVFQGVLRVWDDGRVATDGLLAPGLDDDAIRRDIAREAVVAMNREVEPASIAKNGSRSYFSQWTTTRDSVAGVLVFEAPLVEGVGPPPTFRWAGVAAPQEDTVAIAAGADLVLYVDVVLMPEEPAAQSRQWLLQLSGTSGTLRIGADGVPPDTLIIPARFLPEPANGMIAVTLSYTRSVAVQQQTDYIGLLVLDARVEWTVRVLEPAAIRTHGVGG